MSRFRIAAAVLAVIWATAMVVPHAASADSPRVFVTEVQDTRTTGKVFGRCEVELTVMGPDVARSAGVYDVKVGYAVDDSGRILLRDKPSSHRGFFKFNRDRKQRLTHDVRLKNPNRSAQAIRTLRGRILLFQPTPQNGGKLEVKGFMQQAGQWIDHPSLGASEIKLMYITEEAYKQRRAERNEQIMESEQMEQVGRQLGEAMLKMVENLFSGMLKDYKNSLNFVVDDPLGRLVDIKFYDSQGAELKAASRAHFGEIRSYSFKEKPAAGTRMVVYLATPKSLQPVPFNLQNIALP